jgi:hypothetical protein
MVGRRAQRIEPTISIPGAAPAADGPVDKPARIALVDAPRMSFDPASRDMARKRPIGLTLLAVLLLTGGGGLFALQVLAFDQLLPAYEAIGISALSAVSQTLALSFLCVVAGIQIWEGSKWGWILAMAALLYSVATSLQGLTMTSLLDVPAPQGWGAILSYLKYGLKALLHIALIYYLFRAAVLDFFEIGRASALAYFGGIFGLITVLYILLSVVP